MLHIKGSLVHVAPACAGSGEWSDHFGSYVRSLSRHCCKRLFPGLELMTSWSQGNNFTVVLGLPFLFFKKRQPGARSSHLCRVRGRVRPLWVLCTQPLLAFLQEAISKTGTHDLMVTRQQLYCCTRAPLHVNAPYISRNLFC
jgi:hypothetical protein